MKNFAVWFDIPVADIDRAIEFYSKVFAVKLDKMEGAPKGYAMFPHETGNVSGGLVVDPDLVGQGGVRLYLNGGSDLNTPLARVEAAGGKVLQKKTSLGPNGFMALFEDSEGNSMALHSDQ